MKPFSISSVYLGVKGTRCIDINPLPENYCSFDCVFCPLGRTKVKTDESFNFEKTKGFLAELEEVLKKEKVEYVFINPDGEALANEEILGVIRLIKANNAIVKLLCNGYLMTREEYRGILNECDEVVGELAVTTEEKFQKVQRPLEGYTLKKYISNMEDFKKQYPGRFILDITLLKNISDSDEDVERFERYIEMINPHELFIETPSGSSKKSLRVSEERINEISRRLFKIIQPE